MAEQEIRFEHRMSDADALMWNIEKDPALRSTITAVYLFDREVPRDDLVERFERVTRAVPRLRQRVRSNLLSLAPPRWEVDPNFDLAFHLWWVKCPGKGTLGEVLHLAEPIAMSGFDRARPQWRAIVVEGMRHQQSALILKVHHSITDGVGGMKMQLEMLDLEADAPPRPMPPKPNGKVMSQPERFVDAFDHLRRRQLGIAKRSVAGLPGLARSTVTDPAGTANATTELLASVGRVLAPATAPLSPLMTGRSLSSRFDTLTIPLDQAKKAAKAAGGKLNDAFVAGLTRGLYQYHVAHGVECATLRMAIPINVRGADLEGVAGNAFVPARIEVPIDDVDPIESMRRVRALVEGARTEPANELVDPLSNVLNRLPTTALTALFGSMVKSVDFTSSNVPGAPFPVYMGPARLLAQFPFGPLAGAALNVTLLSYQNDCNIGINSDPEAIPDPEVLLECLREAYDEVLAVG